MLRIIDITAPDINNGNGIRVTLWVAGCNHKCKGCHNAWTWKYEQGKVFFESQTEIYDKLSNWLKRDYVDGLTISGGDPLAQDNYPSKTIWLYTGYTKEEIDESHNHMMQKVINSIDILVDGPYIEEKRDIAHTPFRGSTNQRIINIKK